MDILLISLGCVALAIVAWSPRLHRLREKHAAFFQYVLTLFGTFVGVFLAVAVTNRATANQDRERVTALLDVAFRDLRTTTNQAGTVYVGLRDTTDADSSGSEFVMNNPQPLPTTYFEIMNNEMVLSHVTPETFAATVVSRHNLEKVVGIMNTKRLSNRRLKHLIDLYGRELAYNRDLMRAEIDYQNGKIDLAELTTIENELSFLRMGISPARFDSALARPPVDTTGWISRMTRPPP